MKARDDRGSTPMRCGDHHQDHMSTLGDMTLRPRILDGLDTTFPVERYSKIRKVEKKIWRLVLNFFLKLTKTVQPLDLGVKGVKVSMDMESSVHRQG